MMLIVCFLITSAKQKVTQNVLGNYRMFQSGEAIFNIIIRVSVDNLLLIKVRKISLNEQNYTGHPYGKNLFVTLKL
jgi:hypothetical protein